MTTKQQIITKAHPIDTPLDKDVPKAHPIDTPLDKDVSKSPVAGHGYEELDRIIENNIDPESTSGFVEVDGGNLPRNIGYIFGQTDKETIDDAVVGADYGELDSIIEKLTPDNIVSGFGTNAGNFPRNTAIIFGYGENPTFIEGSNLAVRHGRSDSPAFSLVFRDEINAGEYSSRSMDHNSEMNYGSKFMDTVGITNNMPMQQPPSLNLDNIPRESTPVIGIEESLTSSTHAIPRKASVAGLIKEPPPPHKKQNN